MLLLTRSKDDLANRLKFYQETDKNYRAIFAYTKESFDAANHLTAHNWAHVYRDTINAIEIGEAENADMKIVMPATTMHDIGFLYGAEPNIHGAIGAEKLNEFIRNLGLTYSEEELGKIADCIRTHKGDLHGEVPGSLEAEVVADADFLEKFGPFGIYQTVRTYAEFNWPIERIIERKEKIMKVDMFTGTGKQLAAPGRQLITDFYNELEEVYNSYPKEP